MMSQILVVVAAFLGLTVLCAGQYRNAVAILGGQPSRRCRAGLLGLGWGMVAASAGAAVATQGTAIGMVAWCLDLTVAALAVTALRSYRPAVLTGVAGPVAVVLSWGAAAR